ncbi:hypothetical protein TrVE_jg13901 [Triparma verrucosa]|uniref:Uncharacterized protein n=1 Tax=Triparma verrucosa TaxID=1606542 RepID=A0A9W7ELH4_9STRA|nr:hypothetical protein TrVE_jg13901 [Triparma verrucosa]
MLGLISFTLFFVSQLSDLTDDHVHLIEFVHLTLFLMMVFYYLVTGWIAYSSKKCLSKFGDYEEKVANFDLVECISELKSCKATRAKEWWYIDAPRHLIFGDSELDKRMHLNAYLLTRHFFLVSQGLPPDLPFDYAEYIDRCSSALCVKLVQVGWRTWAGILCITMISTGVTLIIDVSDGSFDQIEEMWADSAAINLNYFWSMFFMGWVLYLINGLIWAGFERSRASLILLTAKKEAMGDNVRASRFDRSFDAGHFDEEDEYEGHEDDRSEVTESSMYGNMLRSTVSRDWSHGNRHSHHIQQAKDRKENTDAIRQAHMKAKNKEDVKGGHGGMPEPTIAAIQSPPPSNRTSQVSRASRASHRSGTSSKHSDRSHRRTHHNSSTCSGHGSTRGDGPEHGHGGEGGQHRDSLEKTVRPVSHKMCPWVFVDDEWRHCFPLKAPEFPLRTFQGVLMFFSLFLGMGLLIFFHIDPMFMAFSIFQPFLYLYLFGLQQVPFYASLRFFGPTLSKNSLVDDLVFFAQELQLEEYAMMGREESGKKGVGGNSFSTSMRSSTTFVGGKIPGSSISGGSGSEVGGSKPGSERATEQQYAEEEAKENGKIDSEGLLRGWGDAPKSSFAPRMSVRNSQTRISFREPTIIEDEAAEPGALLRGWGGDPTLRGLPSSNPPSQRQSTSSNPRNSAELHRLSMKFEHRHSHLSRDTHLENFYKKREVGGERAGSEGQIKACENTSLNETSRRSMNNLSLFAALRLSESRMSSRTGGSGSNMQPRGAGEAAAAGHEDWKNFSFNGNTDFNVGLGGGVSGVGGDGLLSPLMEDRAREDGRSRDNDSANVLNVSGGSDGFHNYHTSVNLHVDPQVVQREYATQEMLDEVCQLLNTTTTKNFFRIAVMRCTILGFFIFLFLTSSCEVSPTEKLQCTWLDII